MGTISKSRKYGTMEKWQEPFLQIAGAIFLRDDGSYRCDCLLFREQFANWLASVTDAELLISKRATEAMSSEFLSAQDEC